MLNVPPALPTQLLGRFTHRGAFDSCLKDLYIEKVWYIRRTSFAPFSCVHSLPVCIAESFASSQALT